MTIHLTSADRKVLAALHPGEPCFRVFDGLPDRIVVKRIAHRTGVDEDDVYYSLKHLRMVGKAPTPPLELVLDLLTDQIQAAVTRLSADAPLPLFDEKGEPLPGAVVRVQQHCAFSYTEVERRLVELRAGDYDPYAAGPVAKTDAERGFVQ